MNKLFLFIIVSFISTIILGQTAYIQVTGESGLSVFLNNQFKGITSPEYNGYIIENVTPGNNLVKIVKTGFTPFEETITVKPGEVFAYKVKPFTKHIVSISEQGNTAATVKKAIVKTGTLIIQSVPIEIKITIPDIEGIDNKAKTKDEWIAEEIPAGSYTINFTFNKKVISKKVDITGNETTSVFVNMMNGDFTTKNTLDEKIANERAAYIKHAVVYKFIDSVSKEYKFRVRIKEDDLRKYNTEAAGVMTNKNWKASSKNGYGYRNSKDAPNGPTYISFDESKELVAFSYDIISSKNKLEIANLYNNIKTKLEHSIPDEFIRKGDSYISVYYPKMNVEVQYNLLSSSYFKTSTFSIFFLVIDR